MQDAPGHVTIIIVGMAMHLLLVVHASGNDLVCGARVAILVLSHDKSHA